MLLGMKKNPNGWLTICIQNKSPGKAKEANWLPAPNVGMINHCLWNRQAPSVSFGCVTGHRHRE